MQTQLDEGARRILPNDNTGHEGVGGGNAATISLDFGFQLVYLPYERTCITDHMFNSSDVRKSRFSLYLQQPNSRIPV
jgi:hypothetical protein